MTIATNDWRARSRFLAAAFVGTIQRSKRMVLAGLICLAAIVVVWQQVDADALRAALAKIAVLPAVLALGMLTLGAFMASVRLRSITTDIGARLSLRDAAMAMSLGQVAGALSVQFFGQIAARSAFLARRGFTLPDNVAIAVYERIVAVTVSASLAIGGAWFLFGHIVLDLDGGGRQFLYILAGTVAATLSAAVFGWGRLALPLVWPLFNLKVLSAVARLSLLTLAIQATTATAYVAIARSLAPDVDLTQLIAASFIVMFAASLPISFAGWGVREISAIFALNFIGVPTPAALLTAVLVGVFSIAATAIVGSVAATTRSRALPPTAQNDESSTPAGEPAIDFGLWLAWIIPIATAVVIFFQIYVPTGKGEVNVNLADPLAILGGAVFVWSLVNRRYVYRWRISYLWLHAALATALLVAAFVRGWIGFGWTDWAFYNKLIGWFVLLGYFGCGALIVGAANTPGLTALLRTFVAAGSAVVVVALVTVGALLIEHDYSKPTNYIHMVGFSQNRNAFSFQILLMMAATIVVCRTRPAIALLTLFGFTVFLGGSRAAFGALVVAAIVYVYLNSGPMKAKLKTLVAFAAVAGAVALTMKAIAMSGNGAGAFQPWTISNNYDSAVRWQSISGGLSLFWQSPVWGAGLGAFMHSNGATLQIHSTPVWLLAETGLIGLIVFAVPALRLFVAAWRDADTHTVAAVIILVLIAFAVLASVHEMLYQRVFWFLLGALSLSSSAPARSELIQTK